jgi:N-acylneuraminate cytidylyltransferase
MRSEKTSNDYAGTNDVIAEVLEEYEKRGKTFDSFCCIYPTAPFITAEKLRESAKLLDDEYTYTVVPVVQYSYPPQRSIVIRDGFVEMQFPEITEARSQDLEPIYHDCGQFYWGKTKPFIQSKILIGNKTRPFVLPESEVQDIDNEEDWKLAELKFNFLQNKL